MVRPPTHPALHVLICTRTPQSQSVPGDTAEEGLVRNPIKWLQGFESEHPPHALVSHSCLMLLRRSCQCSPLPAATPDYARRSPRKLRMNARSQSLSHPPARPHVAAWRTARSTRRPPLCVWVVMAGPI